MNKGIATVGVEFGDNNLVEILELDFAKLKLGHVILERFRSKGYFFENGCYRVGVGPSVGSVPDGIIEKSSMTWRIGHIIGPTRSAVAIRFPPYSSRRSPVAGFPPVWRAS